MWLKCYLTEDFAASIAGVAEKTFREKVWFSLEGIAQLDVDVVSSCCFLSIAVEMRSVLAHSFSF